MFGELCARFDNRSGLSVFNNSVSNTGGAGEATTTKQALFDLGETLRGGGGRGVGRRRFLAGLGAGAAALGARAALAQDKGPVAPPSTVTSPPRDFGPNAAPNVYFWDPDILAVDPSFNGLAQPNAPIQRLWTGALWSEGPAWNSVGRFLVWSDILNNRQMRYLDLMGGTKPHLLTKMVNNLGAPYDWPIRWSV